LVWRRASFVATHAASCESGGVLWWPPGKITGRYLTPWLAALDEDTIADLPNSRGLAVQTDLHLDVVAS
jgi:hypothetical protein